MKSNHHLLVTLALAITCSPSTHAAPKPPAPLSMEAFKAQVCAGGVDATRTYCRSQIEAFDRKLNVAYRDAIAASSQTHELRLQQRRWLTDVRDRCESEPCAKQALVARVLELHELSVDLLDRREMPMGEEEQRRICVGLAKAASHGEIEDRMINPQLMPLRTLGGEDAVRANERALQLSGNARHMFSLPVRNDYADFIFADVYTGGSCFSSEIQPLSTPQIRPGETWPSEDIDIDIDEQDDHIRWSTWGGSESILVFGGRYFIVSSKGHKQPIGIVTWVTPAGTRRPICSLEVERMERSTSYVRESAALCSAVVKNELTPLHWQKSDPSQFQFDVQEQKELRNGGPPASGMPELELLELDVDNDGKTELLARAQYDSGAGCGWSASTLKLMSDDGKHLRASPLQDALAGLETLNSAKVEIFTYRKSNYVLATLNQNPALFRISKDSVDVECVFHDQPISRVRATYTLNGVVRDIAKPE